MSQIIIGESPNRLVKLDLDILLRTRMLIQANSGKGKSWLLRRIAEQLFGKVQVIIIDPEGEFATLREKFDFVLVGKGGETAAHPRIAALTAQRLLELRACAVVDIYEMKPSERHSYVKLFLDALIDAPKNLWHPLVVILDEAHVYCPEKGAGESEAAEAVIGMATRGRKRGYCLVAATQRLGKFRKDAASELLNIAIGGTFIDIDRKRAADALGVYGQDLHPFFDEIRLLEKGLFYFLGPAVATERTLVKVGTVETTHPEAGSARHAAEAPPTPEKIKALLPRLSDLPKEAEEKAKTIADLKHEIRSLQAQLRAQPKITETKPVFDQAKAQAMVIKAVEAERATSLKFTRHLALELTRLNEFCVKTLKLLDSHNASLSTSTEQSNPVPYVTRSEVVPITITKPIVPIDTDSNGASPSGQLRAGARRLLAALCQWFPQGMTEGQMRAQAKLKKSGTYNTYKSDLKSGGYIEFRDNLVYATQAAMDFFAGDIPETPTTTEEVVKVWEPKLRSGAREMLKVIIERQGEEISRDELAEAVGMVRSGTFNTYLSDLRTAGLIVSSSTGVSANRETLFLT